MIGCPICRELLRRIRGEFGYPEADIVLLAGDKMIGLRHEDCPICGKTIAENQKACEIGYGFFDSNDDDRIFIQEDERTFFVHAECFLVARALYEKQVPL